MESVLFLIVVLTFAPLPLILPFVFMEMTAQKKHPVSDKRRKLARLLGWVLGLSLLVLIVYFGVSNEDGRMRSLIRGTVQFLLFLMDFLK
jgi:hypothetical protein